MKRMSLRKFGKIVRKVLATLPPEIAQYLDNVVVDVEDEPDEQTLRLAGFTDEEIAEGESLYGLFAPMPMTMPDEMDFLDHPHRIFIFKNTLEDDFPNPKQLRTEIRKTVIHELAHHFGLTDRDLERFDSKDDPFGDSDDSQTVGGFKSLGEIALTYQITLSPEPFVQPVAFPVDESFRRRLEFDKLNAPVTASEQAICEFLIAPILQEMWRVYSDALMVWSHVQFRQTPQLKGFPDYFFSKRSPLGLVLDQPYVLFVQAKSDDFAAAWAHCLEAMLVAQQMNQHPEQVIFGSVFSGEVWYFGKLQGKTLIHDPRSFTLTHLEDLFAALNYVFNQAKQQALCGSEVKPSLGRQL